MKLLITGASGLLGSNLVLAALDAGYQVIATSRERRVSIDSVEWLPADLTKSGEADRILTDVKPDWLIHCAAATNVDRCEADPGWARRHNVDMAHLIAEATQRHDVSLLHISTDAIFDGESAPYSETDTPSPINVYARSKLAGEQAVLQAQPRALILRTNFFGWSPSGRKSLAEWFLDGLKAGEQRPGFTDIRVNPLLVNTLCEWILQFMERELSGLYHTGTATCISKFQFGVELAAAYGLDADLVIPRESTSVGLRAARPSNLCLDASRAQRDLGLISPTTGNELARFRQLGEEGYPSRIGSAVAAPAFGQKP